jgi:hypothetical protein
VERLFQYYIDGMIVPVKSSNSAHFVEDARSLTENCDRHERKLN